MHTQTWVVQLFTCHIKTRCCSIKKLWLEIKSSVAVLEMKKRNVVLETAVAKNKKKNGFLYETFEQMGPANKDSAP